MTIITLPDSLKGMTNPHLDRLKHLITASSDESSKSREQQYLFLCFTNRCGSNFVAELLASTGDFNLAGEVFNFDTALNHVKEHKLSNFSQYFSFLFETFSLNGRLTAKLAATHLALLHESGILGRIIDRSKFLVVERNDRLMQAISLSIAAQTGQWTSYMSSRIGPDQLVFSGKQIATIIANITEQQRYFDLFFALNGIMQHKLIYEQLVSEPELYISALARWLGTDISGIDMQKLRLQRQATAVSVAWRESFLAERR